MAHVVKRSFEEVYLEHFSYIYNLIYMHVLHRETAEDLTSETFIKAMNAYDRYDPSISSEKTWLSVIANRLLINHYRSRSSARTSFVEDEILNALPDPTDVFAPILDVTNEVIAALLERLSAEERHLLLLRYYMDAKNQEIAAELDISPKAVSERCRRLLMKCRQLLEDELLL